MEWLHRRICSIIEFLGLIAVLLWLTYLTLRFLNEWIFGFAAGLAIMYYYYRFKDI